MMYYESVEHNLLKVANAEQAASYCFNGTAQSWNAVSWESDGHTFLAVNDAHVNNRAFAETAILLKSGENYFLVESITVAWCTLEKATRHFKEAEKSDLRRRTNLIIGKANLFDKAWFDCGCCGNNFEDFVHKQLKFDQDAGYGICPDCQTFYS